MEKPEEQNWGKYYRAAEKGGCRPPGKNKFLYSLVASEYLSKMIQKPDKLNILIGGASSICTIFDFKSFFDGIRLGKKDNLTVLDQNCYPLKAIKRNLPGFAEVQGRLEKLPFGAETVDLIVLDYTLHFMTEESIENFLKEAKRVLSRDGLVVCLVDRRRKEEKKRLLKIVNYFRPNSFYLDLISKYFRDCAVVNDPDIYQDSSDETIALVFGKGKINLPVEQKIAA